MRNHSSIQLCSNFNDDIISKVTDNSKTRSMESYILHKNSLSQNFCSIEWIGLQVSVGPWGCYYWTVSLHFLWVFFTSISLCRSLTQCPTDLWLIYVIPCFKHYLKVLTEISAVQLAIKNMYALGNVYANNNMQNKCTFLAYHIYKHGWEWTSYLIQTINQTPLHLPL